MSGSPQGASFGMQAPGQNGGIGGMQPLGMQGGAFSGGPSASTNWGGAFTGGSGNPNPSALGMQSGAFSGGPSPNMPTMGWQMGMPQGAMGAMPTQAQGMPQTGLIAQPGLNHRPMDDWRMRRMMPQ